MAITQSIISIRTAPSCGDTGIAAGTKWYISVYIPSNLKDVTLLVLGLQTSQEKIFYSTADDALVNGVTRAPVAMILEILDLSQSNITWCSTMSDRKKAKSMIRRWTHNGHPIARPHGWAMGHLVWVLRRKASARYGEYTVLTIYDKRVTVLHEDGYPLPVPSQC